MERHPYEGHRPGVSPICAFCRAELCESAWFKYELEKAAYVSQSPLLAPDEGDHNPLWQETVPFCHACRQIVIRNAQRPRPEKEAEERFQAQLGGFVPAVLATCFFMFVAICMDLLRAYFKF